jgi:hypothetical protein
MASYELVEIERLKALARYASERDRLPVEAAGNANRGSCDVVGNPRRVKWRRWLAGSLLPGLIIDTSFVGSDRSLNIGLTSSDYVSFAEIGALLYVALALAVLARRFWRSEGSTMDAMG